MQSQEQFYQNRESNTDPREMPAGSRQIYQGAKQAPRPARGRGLLLTLILLVVLIGGALWTVSSFTSAHHALPTRTFTLNGHGKLIVDNGSGHVHINSTSGHRVTVHATQFSSGIFNVSDQVQLAMNQDGNIISVTQIPSTIGGLSYDLDITVPDSIDLQIKDGSGDIQVSNINGNTKVQDGSGDIQANHLGGNLDLQTGSGTIRADHLSGQITLQTGSGDIEVNQVELQSDGSLHTGSGDIRVQGTLDANAHYRLESGNGGINLTLPSASAFQLSTNSGSGSIHSDFSSTPDAYSSLDLHTGSGDITVRKE